MSARPIGALIASATLHVAVAALVALGMAGSDSLPPLFVDLTIEAAERDAPPAVREAAARPAPPGLARPPLAPGGARSARARVPSPPSERAAPAAPPLAAAPPPPPVEEVKPVAPEPPVTVPPQVAMDRAPDPLAHEATPPVPPASSAAVRGGSPTPSADASSSTATDDWLSARSASNPDGALARGGDGGSAVGAGPGQQTARAIPGDGIGEPGAEYGPWLRGLRERIQAALRYPATARRRGISGVVTIELTVQPGGAIEEVRVVESSSHDVLDTAALEAVRGVPAFPMPSDLRRRALRVRLPVVFQLR